MTWASQRLGQDGEQVLIRNGNTYIRVNSFCFQFINQNSDNNQDSITQMKMTNMAFNHGQKFDISRHYLNIENSDNKDEDPNTRKSTNHHFYIKLSPLKYKGKWIVKKLIIN